MPSQTTTEHFMTIERVFEPQRVSPTPTFSATRIDTSALQGAADPFMSVDHFVMSAPTFAPHPHAGFSAVTYVLPESEAGMENRDSRGDRSHIPPGGVHWTAAGLGIMHEEVPDPAGSTVEGFQIFVKQPADQEDQLPAIHHVDGVDVPEIPLDLGGRARVLAGAFEGASAPFAPPSPLSAIDFVLRPGDGLEWTSPWQEGTCAIYLFRGEAEIAGRLFQAPKVVILSGAGTLRASSASGARLFLMAGEPLNFPIYSHGPFAMSSEAGVRIAIERYRAGQMGSLS